jgi:hypothetical protein
MEEKERKVSWTVFVWAMGITLIVIGWMFTKMNSLEAKVETIATQSNRIEVQLSQIQTDLQWIKVNLVQGN